MTIFRLKRVYEPADPHDGWRVLVDRLWPRGLRKQAAGLDEWDKDVAPSSSLRTWFGHDPRKWEEFAIRYREELASSGAAQALARRVADQSVVTLLIAAKDPAHNHGLVLLEVLSQHATDSACDHADN